LKNKTDAKRHEKFGEKPVRQDLSDKQVLKKRLQHSVEAALYLERVKLSGRDPSDPLPGLNFRWVS
jgi:hypothetical protein